MKTIDLTQKENSFNEEVYNELKNIFEAKINDWIKISKDAREFKKNEKKNLVEYLSKAEFLAWYLLKEKDLKIKLLYDIETTQWFAYGIIASYLWSTITYSMVEIVIDNLLREIFPWDIYVDHKKQKDLDAIIHELQKLLSLKLSNESNSNYIVMKDQVFDKEKRKIKTNCGPLDYITQYNAIQYRPNNSNPNNIKKWMNFVFKNDPELIKLFQAICQIVLFSNRNYNLNFFVEIRGGGGSGKSLCGRLLQALVGPHLRASTNLKKLHTSPFETATLRNKNLVLMPDQEAYVGGAEVLKMLTGGDLIGGEIKYKDAFKFYFHGVIVILTNAKLTYSSAESAILRRRITFNFDQIIESENIDTDLLNIDDNNQISGKWEQELPDFMSWVLELSKEDTKNIITKHLNRERQNVDEFSFMLWIRNHLMPFKDGRIGIMHKRYGPSLYDHYKEFMQRQGMQPVKCPSFESNMEKDFQSSFPGGYNLRKEITKYGKTYVGLMYQDANFPGILTPSEQLDFIEKWRKSWQERYGKNFFGQNTLNNKDNLTRNEEIYQNAELVNQLSRNKNTLQSSIGFPKKNLTDTIFNSQTAIYYLQKDNTEIKIEIDPDILLAQFLNQFIYDQNAKLTTENLFEQYTNFIRSQGENPSIEYKKIKDEVIKKWNEMFPNQLIKPAKNITRKKLKGIKGLKIKSE